MSRHVCPTRCHVCPDLYAAYLEGCRQRGERPDEPKGVVAVLPGCMGGAVYPDIWKDRCTCYRGSSQNPIEELEARVSQLEAQLAKMVLR